MKKNTITDLPYSLEEEKIVLGMMIVDDILRSEALGSLTVEDFFEGFSQNRLIFNALSRIYNKNISLEDDPSFLSEELRLVNDYEESGGSDYIRELINLVSTTVNFEEHVRILKNYTTLRKLLKLIRQTDNSYLTKGADDVQGFVDEFSRQLEKINQSRRFSTFIGTDELIERYRKELPLRAGNQSDLAFGAVTTGYADLDHLTNGFKRGEYIIIAGRPSMGKTALALNIAINCARRSNKAIGFFSLEMSSQALVQRMLSIEGRIEGFNLVTGKLSDDDYAKLESAYESFSRFKLFIDDSADNNVMTIAAKATKLKNSHPDLGLIIIDYLGRIPGDPKRKSEQEQVAEISRNLKSLAKTLDIPVVVLSQLSRAPDGRTSKKPITSDLRSSGAIEQDADVVMLLYREAYYLNEKQDNENSTFAKKKNSAPEPDSLNDRKRQLEQRLQKDGLSLTEVIVSKNRNGKTGVVRLAFNLGYGSFDLLSKEYQDQVVEIYGGGEVE